FEIATTREGSGVTLITELPTDDEGGTGTSCSWWRRGRVELFLKRKTVVWFDLGWILDSVHLNKPEALSLTEPYYYEGEDLDLHNALVN
ncbi:MAG: hypothetical protein SVY53_08625, partial [Chloroflexota bacterium]|nr:hypothetical protein [Chloroflexota bacterium]